MLIKLADLRWCQHRNRPSFLVGKAGELDLLLVGRSNLSPGEPDFTLFIGRHPVRTDAKPLPPVWDPVRTRWIGPAEPDYPGFYDDTDEVIADLIGDG